MFRFILPPNKRTTDDAFVALLCFCHVALAHARHAVTLHKIQIQELGAHYSRVGVVKLSNGLFEITKIGRGGGGVGVSEINVKMTCCPDLCSFIRTRSTRFLARAGETTSWLLARTLYYPPVGKSLHLLVILFISVHILSFTQIDAHVGRPFQHTEIPSVVFCAVAPQDSYHLA